MTGHAKQHDYYVRVGYADTDRMSFVHHSRYLVYMESARTEMLRAMGQSYKEWEESGLLLPLVEAHVNYRRPAIYDDMLRVRVRITQLTKLRLRFDYEVFCEERQEQIATGHTAHVFMNKDLRPVRAGTQFMETLRPYVEEQENSAAGA